MIIDAKAILLTLFVVTIGCYFGLKFVRAFALRIARENHDAIAAMDQADEEKRRKQERAAEAAEESAYAKVQPILTTPAVTTTTPVSTAAQPSGGSEAAVSPV